MGSLNNLTSPGFLCQRCFECISFLINKISVCYTNPGKGGRLATFMRYFHTKARTPRASTLSSSPTM